MGQIAYKPYLVGRSPTFREGWGPPHAPTPDHLLQYSLSTPLATQIKSFDLEQLKK